MVFSSFVFLLVFLPVVLITYYIMPSKLRNLVLLIASLLFYAWGEPVYVLIMVFSTVFDYTNGRLIDFYYNKNNYKAAKTVLIIDLCGNLAILGFFKYTDFFIETINGISGVAISPLNIALPIGISFYTFQTMSYSIDVYKRVVNVQKNFINFATYVCLFPQLIAGPIVQYKTIGEELDSRKENIADFSEGAFRFSLGLAKKVLLANPAGAIFTSFLDMYSLSAASAWLGVIAYTFQIYFDFSGYSDMAIGLGQMFGFHFLENFNHPYESKSITEFWRRWHISLGSWFREYVYIPLGGNRRGLSRQIINMTVVWFLTGLWHGASWNFVLWGMYYGILLIIEKSFLLKLMDKLPKILQHIYTMFLVVIGWGIFAITDFAQLKTYFVAMFFNKNVIDSTFVFYLKNNLVLFILLIICSINIKDYFNVKVPIVAKHLFMVIILILSVAFLVGDSYNPFLYFRF